MGNMKIFKIALLIGIFFLEVSVLKPGLNCRNFSGEFHFSLLDLRLQIEEAIYNDKTIPLFWVRFFHNKATFFVLDIFRRWLMSWDVRFLLSYLLPMGVFGFGYGIWISLRTKKSYLSPFIFYLIFAFLVEVVFAPKFKFLIKIFSLILPCQLFSLFGWWQFLKAREIKVLLFATGFFLISFWWQRVFPYEFMNFCVK